MSQLFAIAVANAVLASLLAIVVWLVSKWIRRSVVVHLLWVLVLLRLVMPPVVLVNVVGARDCLVAAASTSSGEAVAMAQATGQRHLRLLAAVRDALARPDLLPMRTLIPPTEEGATVGEFVPVRNTVTLFQTCWQFLRDTGKSLFAVVGSLATWTCLVWLMGSVICFLTQVFQVLVFRRRLQRIAYHSRVWQARTEKVARRMGLRSCPEVLLVRATISPMLWGFGKRTCVLFPERLLENLSTKAQNTLLAHELAHYRRGDQWVRLLELTATVLYWWHPVLWWARREIEKTEELCCDAWALRLADGSPRTYAEALLAAIDFVSGSLPPVSCGANHRNLMKQRLEAIMCDRRIGNGFTPDAYPSVLCLALLLLLPCPGLWSKSAPAPLKIPMAAAFAGVGAGERRADVSSQGWSFSPDCITHKAHCEVALSETQQAVFRNHEAGIEVDLGVGVLSSACFSGDATSLAIGTLQGQVKLIDCASGEIVRHIDLGPASVGSVAFSPDDSQLAVGTRGGLCKLIDLSGARQEEIIRREPGTSVDCVRFSKEGRFAAVLWSRRSNQRIELWDLVAGRVSATLHDQAHVMSLASSPRRDGKSWLIFRSDGSASRWLVDEGLFEETGLVRISPEKLRHLRLAPAEDETQFLRTIP